MAEATTAIRDALLETLQRTGTLDSIRSQLRADVYQALDESLAVSPVSSSTEQPPLENILINELLADYLAFNGYNNTLSVFATETGTPSLQEAHGGVRRYASNKKKNTSLGLDFIRNDLGLARRHSPLAMMYEIIDVLKRRRSRDNSS